MIRARWPDGFVVMLPLGREVFEDLAYRPELIRIVKAIREEHIRRDAKDVQ